MSPNFGMSEFSPTFRYRDNHLKSLRSPECVDKKEGRGTERKEKQRRWLLAAGAVLALFIIRHPSLAWMAACRGAELFQPFFTGLSMAFIFNVPLRFIEEKLGRGRFPRWLGLVLTYLAVTGLLSVLLFLIVPQLQKSGRAFLEQLPGYLERARQWLTGLLARITPQAEGIVAEWEGALTEWVGRFGKSGPEMVAGMISETADIAAGAVFSVYLLARKEALCRSCRRVIFAFLPKAQAEHLVQVSHLAGGTFSRFVSGQMVEALLLGSMCFLGMALFRMPYAPLISAIIGVTALVPIFGAIFGAAAGALLLFMVNPATAVWFLAFILVLQQIEGNFLYPKVVGESIGLPGIWVLLAVLVGGEAFGVWGMLAGIPLASVAYTLFREEVARRLKDKKRQ